MDGNGSATWDVAGAGVFVGTVESGGSLLSIVSNCA
jgi:hypothetical protein